jgi:hypothetical protein
MTEIRVVGAVADQEKVVFYLENGDTITLKQTDPRLEKVLSVVVPLTTKNEVAIIDLETYSVFREYEEKSNGFIKFFKAAKNAVSGILGGSLDNNMKRQEVLAAQPMPKYVPTKVSTPAYAKPLSEVHTESMNKPPVDMTRPREPIQSEPTKETSLQKHQNNLKPLNGIDDISENETIVAVIGDIVIPEMEKLKPYIQHALKNNSTEAVGAFLKRIIPHIENRGHSIQDLFKFMELGDMPIADDGSIIAYKILAPVAGETDVYVDKHSRKVRQKVGSYVCVNESLVDRNRQNECSNGLHIARRSYAAGFGSYGDVCVMIKLAPEDVVTVPHGDPSKIRAMGYHIVGLLNAEGYALVKKNEPMTTDNKAANFIANVIKGNHIGRIQEVRIGGQMGTNITYTDFIDSNEIINDDTITSKAIDHDGPGVIGTPINIRDLNKQVNDIIEEDTGVEPEEFEDDIEGSGDDDDDDEDEIDEETVDNPPTPEGEKIIHQALAEVIELPAQRAARLKREMRAAKKIAETSKQEIKATPAKTTAPKVTPSKAKPKAATKPEPKKEAPKPSKVEPKKPVTAVGEARKLYNAGSFTKLREFKKSKKKSWSALGFTEAEEKNITK